MDSLPPLTEELRPMVPFLQRAKELKGHDEVIRYYCLLHAIQFAMNLKSQQPESRNFIIKGLDALESIKKDLADNDTISNSAASSAYVFNFAMRVFTVADNQDRAGKATKAVANNFLTASQFLELMTMFGEVDEEVSEKIRYAKWKAVDILKALREGRTPTPGPAGGLEADQSITSTTTEEDSQQVERELVDRSSPTVIDVDALPDSTQPAFALDHPAPSLNRPPVLPSTPTTEDSPTSRTSPLSPSDTILPSIPSANKLDQLDPSPYSFYSVTGSQVTPTAPPLPPPQSAPSAVPVFPSAVLPSFPPSAIPSRPTPPVAAPAFVDPGMIMQAQKHAKFAISALNYDDIITAKAELNAALRLLG